MFPPSRMQPLFRGREPAATGSAQQDGHGSAFATYRASAIPAFGYRVSGQLTLSSDMLTNENKSSQIGMLDSNTRHAGVMMQESAENLYAKGHNVVNSNFDLDKNSGFAAKFFEDAETPEGDNARAMEAL